MNILIIDPQFDHAPDIEQEIAGPHARFSVWRTPTQGSVPESSLRECTVLINCRSRNTVTGQNVAVMDNCKIVAQAGVGFNHIDIEACAARGIPVCITPDYGTTEVADHALALALALTRGIVAYDAKLRTRAMGWHAREQRTVRRLRGATFGIAGLGRIGIATALRAKAFETQIAFYDPYVPPGLERAFGFRRANSLAELFSWSDIASIHTPLTTETYGFVGRDALAAAKPGMVLVNTSRGGTMDLDAVYAALKEDRIGGAALDVLPAEPLDYAHPLLAAFERSEDWLDGRLIVTPHAAFFSPDSLADMRRIAMQTVVNYLADGTLRACVNEEMLAGRHIIRRAA
ncbi:MAG: C-terminal binding protein [Pseudomonadota bacterium]